MNHQLRHYESTSVGINTACASSPLITQDPEWLKDMVINGSWSPMLLNLTTEEIIELFIVCGEGLCSTLTPTNVDTEQVVNELPTSSNNTASTCDQSAEPPPGDLLNVSAEPPPGDLLNVSLAAESTRGDLLNVSAESAHGEQPKHQRKRKRNAESEEPNTENEPSTKRPKLSEDVAPTVNENRTQSSFISSCFRRLSWIWRRCSPLWGKTQRSESADACNVTGISFIHENNVAVLTNCN